MIECDNRNLKKVLWELRLLLPAGEEYRVSRMLEFGLRSAVQISRISKLNFMELWRKMYEGEEAVAMMVYRNAITRRAYVALEYVRRVQTREPHCRVMRCL